jgi:hypothetical protein
MKKRILCFIASVFMLLVLGAGNLWAQESKPPLTFERGQTYIRYHLLPHTFSDQNLDTLTNSTHPGLTIASQTIRAIDAYFECPPEISRYFLPQPTSPRIFEAQQQPLLTASLVSPVSLSARAEGYDRIANWKVGKIGITLGYDSPTMERSLVRPFVEGEAASNITGGVHLPIGETGFALRAYLALFAKSPTPTAKDTPAQRTPADLSQPLFSAPLELARLQYATTRTRALQNRPLAANIQGNSAANAVAGAVNFSGSIKGVNVFTEVGAASVPADASRPSDLEAVTPVSFYASGGAQYTVGQVTLGVEAGFERGETFGPEANDSLGFENDFWIEDLSTPENAEPGIPLNKVYATLSASMSPTERMMVEGAFSYVQPFEEGKQPSVSGLGVNGAFYYSLTHYLRYLVKAGISATTDSLTDHQYKVTNQLEFSY